MSFGVVSEDSLDAATVVLPTAIGHRKEVDREIDRRKRSHDPGIWGTVSRKAVDASTILHTVERTSERIYDHFHPDDFSQAADPEYNWKNDASKYEKVYPRSVFEGSRSAIETQARIMAYEDDVFQALAMADRPFSSFVGNCLGFTVDVAAVRKIPFIGGIGPKAANMAGRIVENTILRGAVAGSIGFASDVASYDLLRAIADDRHRFGDVVGELPRDMVVGALLGGVMGGMGGIGKAALEKFTKQVAEGTAIPRGPSIADGEYGAMGGYDAAVGRQAASLAGKMVDMFPTIPGEEIAAAMETLVEVVGGVGENSVTEVHAKLSIARLAFDPLTRAFASPSDLLRKFAHRLHDSHLVADGIENATTVDVAAKTETTMFRGKGVQIVEDVYRKICDDKMLPPLTKQEVSDLLGDIHLNGGELPAALDPQLAAILEGGYGRISNDVFRPLEESFLALKKLHYGPRLVAESKKAVANAQESFAELSRSLADFTATRAEKEGREHGRALGKAWKDGLLPKSADRVVAARDSAVRAIKKRYGSLKKMSTKMAAGTVGDIDEIGDRLAEMAAVAREGGNGTLARRLEKTIVAVHSAAEGGDRGIGDLLSSLDGMEREEILAANGMANGHLETLEKFSEKTKNEIRRRHDAQEQRLREELAQAEEGLNAARESLADRESGEFKRDTAEWLQRQDETFIHRNYDVTKILRYPDEFVGTVATNLCEIHGLLPDQASNVAHGLYNRLINGGHSIGRFSSPALERGAVHGRDFEYSTAVIRDWLVCDIRENIAAVADAVVPDHHLMVEIGTFDGESFRRAFEEEADGLVAAKKLPLGERKFFVDGNVRTLQMLIDGVRYQGKSPPGAVKGSRAAWQASAIARSLTTVVAMGRGH